APPQRVARDLLNCKGILGIVCQESIYLRLSFMFSELVDGTVQVTNQSLCGTEQRTALYPHIQLATRSAEGTSSHRRAVPSPFPFEPARDIGAEESPSLG